MALKIGAWRPSLLRRTSTAAHGIIRVSRPEAQRMRPFVLLTLLGLLHSAPGAATNGPPTGLLILQYHHVSVDTPPSTSIRPNQFRAHMKWLDESGYTVLSLPDAIERLRTGKTLPDRSIAITFDDGYRDIYVHAFPELERRGWPFTVFINPEPHDQQNPNWMSWDELRDMAAASGTIANHTRSHLFMLRQAVDEDQQAWLARLQAEIETAERRIREETTQEHKLLAYPYGESNPAIRKLAAELGYVAFGQQSGPAGRTSDFTNLPRFPLSGPYADMIEFETKMQSLPMPVTAAEPATQSDSEVLANTEVRPELALTLAQQQPEQVNCFATGQGQIRVAQQGNTYLVQATADLPVGRSRYNCTYRSAWPGRYYWYSYTWVRKGPADKWVHE